ncbi:MAG: hypothetical protein ABI651_19525, partial [Verrucomicrobiota bacterium]
MPTIFIKGYKFRFYSSDVNEPRHVYVSFCGGWGIWVELPGAWSGSNTTFQPADRNRQTTDPRNVASAVGQWVAPVSA